MSRAAAEQGPPASEPDGDRLRELVERARVRVAIAESLTGGQLSAALAAAPGASKWFRGGIVAYASDVKYDVLGVPHGPVVSEAAASAMATGACRLLSADVAVAVTGVGGPDPQDGEPPGTVWFALHHGTTHHTRLEHFAGDPPEIVRQACARAKEILAEHLGGASGDG